MLRIAPLLIWYEAIDTSLRAICVNQPSFEAFLLAAWVSSVSKDNPVFFDVLRGTSTTVWRTVGLSALFTWSSPLWLARGDDIDRLCVRDKAPVLEQLSSLLIAEFLVVRVVSLRNSSEELQVEPSFFYRSLLKSMFKRAALWVVKVANWGLALISSRHFRACPS